MRRTIPLMRDWKGMAPDNPRDRMGDTQVWRMEDFIPERQGASLESRQGWIYHVTTPLNGYVTAQIWVNTLGGSHHLAATTQTLYNLDVPGTPRVVAAVPGALWPMATLYEYVMVPRTGQQQPVFVRYSGATEVAVATHASTPKGKVATTWQSRFVLGNGQDNTATDHPNRLYFLSQEWGAGLSTTPIWDPKAWWDSSADVTGLAATRNSLLIFHDGTVERLRGTKAPGEGVDDDVWMEPLVGLGGCNEPHTICYWNDNVVFADSRGVYLTDGTTIKDITEKIIGREWRRAYHQDWRISAGVVYNQYVISMVDTTNSTFKKCFVCDLPSRNWQVFNNIPFASFVASIGERERLFGGGLDGKVSDLSPMWTEADPNTDNVDGNGTPVLPQLETAWYQMSQNAGMKRLKHLYFAYNFDETNGQVKVYGCKQPDPTSPADWFLLKTLQEGDLLDNRGQPRTIEGMQRGQIKVGREGLGFAFKIETTGTIKNLKLYDLSAELVPSREESYVA